jgi:tryptophan 2,3-dioxygenase
LIEVLLGIPIEGRKYGSEAFLLGVFTEEHRERIADIRSRESFNDLIEKWLERMPFCEMEVQSDLEDESGEPSSFRFWDEYQSAVQRMLTQDEHMIQTMLRPGQQEAELKSLKSLRNTFEALFDEKLHNELVERKVRRWSQKAMLGALFIFLYRHEPVLGNLYY